MIHSEMLNFSEAPMSCTSTNRLQSSLKIMSHDTTVTGTAALLEQSKHFLLGPALFSLVVVGGVAAGGTAVRGGGGCVLRAGPAVAVGPADRAGLQRLGRGQQAAVRVPAIISNGVLVE